MQLGVICLRNGKVENGRLPPLLTFNGMFYILCLVYTKRSNWMVGWTHNLTKHDNILFKA